MPQTNVLSDMNGSVWKIMVSEGDSVAEDDTLAGTTREMLSVHSSPRSRLVIASGPRICVPIEG